MGIFRVPAGSRSRGRTTTRTARARSTCSRARSRSAGATTSRSSLTVEPGDMLYVPPRETHIVAQPLGDRARRVRRRPRLADGGLGRGAVGRPRGECEPGGEFQASCAFGGRCPSNAQLDVEIARPRHPSERGCLPQAAAGPRASGDQIRYRTAASRLRPVYRGVYAVGHDALPQRGRLIAALLVAGPGAALSHGTAAALWKLIRSMPPFIEITTTGRAPKTRPGLPSARRARWMSGAWAACRSPRPYRPSRTSPPLAPAGYSKTPAARRSTSAWCRLQRYEGSAAAAPPGCAR